MSGHIGRKKIIAFPAANSSSGSGFPTAPPSPVRIGKTLIVSSQGSVTPAREDVAFHFTTFDSAYAAYQNGDIILVFPGDYVVTSLVDVTPGDVVNINLFAGARLTKNANEEFFNVSGGELNITGDGILEITSPQPLFVITDGTTNINASTLQSITSSIINAQGGEINLNVTDKCYRLMGNQPGINIYDIDSAIKFNAFINKLESDSLELDVAGCCLQALLINANSEVNLTFNTSVAQSVYGCFYLIAHVGKINVNGKLAVSSYIGVSDIASVFLISSFLTDAIRVNCDISTTGDVNGIVVLYAVPNTTSGGLLIFNGKVKTEDGYCIYVSGDNFNRFSFDGVFISNGCAVKLGSMDNFIQPSGKNLIVDLKGYYKGTGDSVIYCEWDIDTAPMKLNVDAIVVNGNDIAFSIQSLYQSANVNILKLIANVPTDVDSIVEIINDAIVDPNII